MLFAHPDVADVAVVGIPDDRWGEQVAAFIRVREGGTPTPAELTTHVRDQLAGFKVPRSWIFVDSFPLTGSGKIQKFLLRDQLIAGTLHSLPLSK